MKTIKNYVPGSVSFAMGFLGPPRSIKGEVFMLADEQRAKRIVKRLLKEGRQIERAELGLDGDWRENSTAIWEGGTFHKYDAYEGSGWATPTLIVYFKDGPSEAYESWKPGEIIE